MWYLFKVYVLVAGVIFSIAGMMILAMFVWQKAKAVTVDLYKFYLKDARPYSAAPTKSLLQQDF